MAELVDALDSKSGGAIRVGSSPTAGTNIKEKNDFEISSFFYNKK